MTSPLRIVPAWLATGVIVLGATAGPVLSQTKKPADLTLKDLPAAVQKTVQETLKGATIKHISMETEAGIQQFEIESVLNGHARDFNVDAKGTLLVIEEATTISAIPAAARAAIVKKAAGGQVRVVETFERPGKPMLYEAGYADAKGKAHEVLVSADGVETKP